MRCQARNQLTSFGVDKGCPFENPKVVQTPPAGTVTDISSVYSLLSTGVKASVMGPVSMPVYVPSALYSDVATQVLPPVVVSGVVPCRLSPLVAE